MQPRLKIDIGWHDLASIWLPVRKPRGELEGSIASHAPAGVFPVVGLSVRSLFLAVLEEAAAGRPVAMSAVTVDDMATLARACGSRVVPIDIEIGRLLPDPGDARLACGVDAAMVVIAHLYGSRGSVEPIATACSAPGRLIVEDCAQAFDGCLRLSPGADIALYSFGPIKTATALGGAIALFADAALAERVGRRMAEWPPLGDAWFLKRAAKYAALKLLGIPALYGFFLALVARVSGDSEKLIGSLARGFAGRPIAEAVRHRPPPRLLRLLDRRLRSWTPRDDATASLLGRLAQRITVPGLAAKPAHWWLAPVLATNADDLVAKLRLKGYDATRGTTSMRALADDSGQAPHNAAELMTCMVYLPKPADEAAGKRLAESVEQAIEHPNSAGRL